MASLSASLSLALHEPSCVPRPTTTTTTTDTRSTSTPEAVDPDPVLTVQIKAIQVPTPRLLHQPLPEHPIPDCRVVEVHGPGVALQVEGLALTLSARHLAEWRAAQARPTEEMAEEDAGEPVLVPWLTVIWIHTLIWTHAH